MYFNGTESQPIDLFPGKDYEAYRVQVEKSGNGTVDMNYVNITNRHKQRFTSKLYAGL